jgi:ABC-type Fe3+-citrate transport system substrate-binding protein
VFLSWWIYIAIPKSEDAKQYTFNEWLEMYGMIDDIEKEKSAEERLKEHKEEISRAYRNVDKLLNPPGR